MSTPPPHRIEQAANREHEGALTYDGHSPSPARVLALHRSARDRSLRAAKTWAVCWALAVAAVFLPLLHFVLVPALLAAGPLMAWRRLHETASLVSAEGRCPACTAEQRFTLGEAWRERTPLRCESCGRRVELVLPAEPAD